MAEMKLIGYRDEVAEVAKLHEDLCRKILSQQKRDPIDHPGVSPGSKQTIGVSVGTAPSCQVETTVEQNPKTIDRKPAGYLRSSTFWVLAISAPILWALVIYLMDLSAKILFPGTP